MSVLFDWRRAVIYTHRWLGIAGSLLFVAWFVSGIVMMYVGMPSLPPAERLMRLPPLDLTRPRVTPGEAARAAGATPQRVLVGMLGDRPVYRLSHRGRWTTVFADSGARLDRLTADQAMDVARRFVPEHAPTIRYDGRLTDADQWTLQSRAFMPMHRMALGDADDTYLYVSERTGEPVMKTTRSGRRWAYVGAVLHWLYFTPFRRHSNPVGPVDHLAGDRRLRAVALGSGLGGVAAVGHEAISAQGGPRTLAVCRAHEVAPLRRSAVRGRHLYLDSERRSVDGPMELAPGERADTSAAGGRERRAVPARRHDARRTP